jgi:hypothetical protein
MPARVGAAAATNPTQRDQHLRVIADRGRMGWQKMSGYSWRALVEAGIGTLRATEVAVAVRLLNCMLKPGRPEYVRLA